LGDLVWSINHYILGVDFGGGLF